MNLHFDPHQPWQRAAVDAVVDVFSGQAQDDGANADGSWTNLLQLEPGRVLANLQAVQRRHELAPSPALGDLHLSIEMETGTGKTYAYLRTLYALNRRYGWTRFCIAVPGVAVREGVLKSLEMTATHFAALFDGVAAEWQVYDGQRTAAIRGFCTSPAIQILIINIDAFNKDNNLIYRPDDRLGGRRAIDLIAATRPVVVVDEPQNMESDASRSSIASLNPLCTLRYSATHRRRYHLLYQLDPVRAHDLGLVKSVEVCSVTDAANRPWIAVGAILQRPLRARIEVSAGASKRFTARPGDDLGQRTGRQAYDGWVVDAIDTDAVHFDNGVSVRSGDSWGDTPDRVARAQLEEAVRTHLERELDILDALGPGQMKGLSLFFIDRVARYTGPDAPIRSWFLAAWERLTADPRYGSLAPFPPAKQVHGGYFAQRGKRDVDTRGRSRADDDAYALIMRDKERLLDPAEPLRFIFSHSALREGWDNPNVFVICTLANAHSSIRKRQEIGRGLRLPVSADGRRCWDPRINRLTVVANDSYRSFAADLQREHRHDWGSTAPVRPARDRLEGREFLTRWSRIAPYLRVDLRFDNETFIALAATYLTAQPRPSGILRVERATVSATGQVGIGEVTETTVHPASESSIPDVLSVLGQRTGMGKHTLARILLASGRLDERPFDASDLIEASERAVRAAAQQVLGSTLVVEGSDPNWKLRIGDSWPPDGSDLEVPAGFTVTTPLGDFRPHQAVWTPGRLHLCRRTLGY